MQPITVTPVTIKKTFCASSRPLIRFMPNILPTRLARVTQTETILIMTFAIRMLFLA